jgi:hypothetical protein
MMSIHKLVLNGAVIAEVPEQVAATVSKMVSDSSRRSKFKNVDIVPVFADEGPGVEICIRIFVPREAR